MNATINAICYKSKTLKNGEHPIVLRITKDGKRKYISLGISIDPKFWDFGKNQPTTTCPNKDYIKKIILDKEVEYQRLILEMNSEQKDYTVTTLAESNQKSIKIKSVHEFFLYLIEENQSMNKVGNAKVYKDTLATLNQYKNTEKLDIPFSDIDSIWLSQYEKWLINKGYSQTSISVRFRTLRSAYNKAIEQRCVRSEAYPFDTFKVSKFATKTHKRAISKAEISKIVKLNLDNEKPTMLLSRDIFIFSYFLGGINFTDIAHLQYSNIINNRIVYTRQKTHKFLNMPILNEADIILQRYKKANPLPDDYIFPILNKNIHITAQQQFNRVHKVIGHINPCLKEIAKKANIDTNLTTYVARHSYATVLKRSGVNTSIISESLGHSSEKVTQIYLDSFENSQIDEAMKNLI